MFDWKCLSNGSSNALIHDWSIWEIHTRDTLRGGKCNQNQEFAKSCDRSKVRISNSSRGSLNGSTFPRNDEFISFQGQGMQTSVHLNTIANDWQLREWTETKPVSLRWIATGSVPHSRIFSQAQQTSDIPPQGHHRDPPASPCQKDRVPLSWH